MPTARRYIQLSSWCGRSVRFSTLVHSSVCVPPIQNSLPSQPILVLLFNRSKGTKSSRPTTQRRGYDADNNIRGLQDGVSFMLHRCRGEGGGSNELAKGDDGGIAKERSKVAAQGKAGVICPEIDVGTSSEHDLRRDRGAWCVRLVGGGVAAWCASCGGEIWIWPSGTVYISIESPPLAKLKFCCCCWALPAPKPK